MKIQKPFHDASVFTEAALQDETIEEITVAVIEGLEAAGMFGGVDDDHRVLIRFGSRRFLLQLMEEVL